MTPEEEELDELEALFMAATGRFPQGDAGGGVLRAAAYRAFFDKAKVSLPRLIALARQKEGWLLVPALGGHPNCALDCLNYQGAMADLDSALAVLIRRINGEADLPSAAEWVRLNYPKKAAMLTTIEGEGLNLSPSPETVREVTKAARRAAGSDVSRILTGDIEGEG